MTSRWLKACPFHNDFRVRCRNRTVHSMDRPPWMLPPQCQRTGKEARPRFAWDRFSGFRSAPPLEAERFGHPPFLDNSTCLFMNTKLQKRFRPLVETALRTVENELAESPHRGGSGTLTSGTQLTRRRESLTFALQRIDGEFYGRCVRCGCDLSVNLLEKEPDAVACVECPRPRRRR